ncbi:hypothetical protein BGX24_010509 [Mortierella sp. AD032]|nr:hypothetical protein BGX24_010509 [Mortierella sp. AD032]
MATTLNHCGELALMDYPKAQYWHRKATEQDYRDSRALDSPATVTTPPPAAAAASIVHIDCHLNSTTQRNVVMWDDIRLAFTDALHIRHKARVVPFLRGADLMPLQPLRVAAMPDVTLDIVETTALSATSVTTTEIKTATVGRSLRMGS